MASLVSAVPQKLPTTCTLLLSSLSCGFGHIPPAPAKPFSLVAVFIENVKNTHVGDCRLSVCPSVLSLQGISQPGWASPGPSTGQQPPSFLSSFFPSLLFLSLRPRPPGVCSELGLVPCLGVAGAQLVAAAALAAVPIVGHVRQWVRADQVPAGQKPGTLQGCTPAPCVETPVWGWTGVGGWYLHDVVELQPRVRGWIDQDVGQGVLVVVHLVCQGREGDGEGERGRHHALVDVPTGTPMDAPMDASVDAPIDVPMDAPMDIPMDTQRTIWQPPQPPAASPAQRGRSQSPGQHASPFAGPCHRSRASTRSTATTSSRAPQPLPSQGTRRLFT